jgi:tRNA threonylcarbamoyladenosine biosynthesis protein TsaB
MNLLALDASSDYCSCAVSIGDREHNTIVSRCQHAPRQHGDLILTQADAVLAEAGIAPAELDAIVFSRGPGSFTGVRIACSVAKGIAYGLNIPLVPVSTLQLMAQSAYASQGLTHVAVGIDARMKEVYWCCHVLDKAGYMKPVQDEAVILPELVDCPEGEWIGVGNGWTAYGDALPKRTQISQFHDDIEPCAQHLLPMAWQLLAEGQTVSAEQAEPIYLRSQVTS